MASSRSPFSTRWMAAAWAMGPWIGTVCLNKSSTEYSLPRQTHLAILAVGLVVLYPTWFFFNKKIHIFNCVFSLIERNQQESWFTCVYLEPPNCSLQEIQVQKFLWRLSLHLIAQQLNLPSQLFMVPLHLELTLHGEIGILFQFEAAVFSFSCFFYNVFYFIWRIIRNDAGIPADYYIAELRDYFQANTTAHFAYFPSLTFGQFYIARFVAGTAAVGFGSYSSENSFWFRRKSSFPPITPPLLYYSYPFLAAGPAQPPAPQATNITYTGTVAKWTISSPASLTNYRTGGLNVTITLEWKQDGLSIFPWTTYAVWLNPFFLFSFHSFSVKIKRNLSLHF